MQMKYLYVTRCCPIHVWASHMSIRIWDVPYAYGPVYAYGAEHHNYVSDELVLILPQVNLHSICLHNKTKSESHNRSLLYTIESIDLINSTLFQVSSIV